MYDRLSLHSSENDPSSLALPYFPSKLQHKKIRRAAKAAMSGRRYGRRAGTDAQCMGPSILRRRTPSICEADFTELGSLAACAPARRHFADTPSSCSFSVFFLSSENEFIPSKQMCFSRDFPRTAPSFLALQNVRAALAISPHN